MGQSNDELFSLESVRRKETTSTEKLYCLKVDSPGREFLIGKTMMPTHNTDEAKAAAALKGEASTIVGSIARLGRAAGVHLLIATQRPDSKLISGELKSNLGCRVACGNMAAIASSMVLENTDATRTPGYPKGRGIIKIYSEQERCQFYFAPQSWIDGWLDRRGLNADGTPKSTGPAGSMADDGMELIRGTNMNELQGVDNSEYISDLKEEDARVRAEHAAKLEEMGYASDRKAQLAADVHTTQPAGPVEGSLGYEEAKMLGRPKMAQGSHKKTGRPEDEWYDYGNTMDELMSAGDSPVDDSDSDVDLGDDD